MKEKLNKFYLSHPTLFEVIRFLIVGGVATLVDMFVMGCVMYGLESNIYPTFWNVFWNTPTPKVLSTVLGTGIGFIAGLIVNYTFSIFFVFNEKGYSRSAKGFVIFTLLSLVGLGINMLGMYLGFDLLHIHYWIVKIIVTLIVLIYNYISKRLIIFRTKSNINVNTN